jgi:hypothetical protein
MSNLCLPLHSLKYTEQRWTSRKSGHLIGVLPRLKLGGRVAREDVAAGAYAS